MGLAGGRASRVHRGLTSWLMGKASLKAITSGTHIVGEKHLRNLKACPDILYDCFLKAYVVTEPWL